MIIKSKVGYKPIKWENVVLGQKVYVEAGNGLFGPFIVTSTAAKELSIKTRAAIHPNEDLWEKASITIPVYADILSSLSDQQLLEMLLLANNDESFLTTLEMVAWETRPYLKQIYREAY